MFRNQFSKRFIRAAMSVAVAFSVSAPLGAPAYAQSLNANEAKTRVNIAGRERMLIQRVVKSACFSSLGVERLQYREALGDAENLFEGALVALQDGDQNLGLGAEESDDLLAQFAVISAEWSDVANIADTAVSPKGISLIGLQTLDALGLDMLTKADAVVHSISNTYGQQLEDLPLILSITIDVAGRQRMLSQKMAKEFCLIDAGVATEENRANLAESIRVFNATLAGLQSGLPGMVISAPNYDIRQKLREVASLWAPINTVLQAVVDGGEITDEDRAAVVEHMEAVLKTMNEAVGMYEYVNAVP